MKICENFKGNVQGVICTTNIIINIISFNYIFFNILYICMYYI